MAVLTEENIKQLNELTTTPFTDPKDLYAIVYTEENGAMKIPFYDILNVFSWIKAGEAIEGYDNNHVKLLDGLSYAIMAGLFRSDTHTQFNYERVLGEEELESDDLVIGDLLETIFTILVKESRNSLYLNSIIENKIIQSATESSLPIGFTYIQFPYMPDPVSMGCAGTWEDISHKFDSMFMRIAGDWAKSPTKYYGEIAGFTGDDGYVKKAINIAGVDDSIIGQIILCPNGEKRLIVDVTTEALSEENLALGIKKVVFNSLHGKGEYTYDLTQEDIKDGFLIVQADTIRNHYHLYQNGPSEALYIARGDGLQSTTGTGSYPYFKTLDNNSTSITGDLVGNDTFGRTVEQSETRPMNITVTIWQRVS